MECTTSSIPLAKKVCGDSNWFSFSFSILTFLLRQSFTLRSLFWLMISEYSNKLHLPVENISTVNAV